MVGTKREPVSAAITAYRGLIPAERRHGTRDMRRMAMWVGPLGSFLAFPASDGAPLNVVAFVLTDLDVEESWSAPGDVAAFAAAYAGMGPTVQKVIAAMDSTFRRGIYDREPLTSWSTNRITLLGDSAHAATPHLGQGANQAVEDAITLAVVLEDARPTEIADGCGAMTRSLHRLQPAGSRWSRHAWNALDPLHRFGAGTFRPRRSSASSAGAGLDDLRRRACCPGRRSWFTEHPTDRAAARALAVASCRAVPGRSLRECLKTVRFGGGPREYALRPTNADTLSQASTEERPLELRRRIIAPADRSHNTWDDWDGGLDPREGDWPMEG